tara:strand:+ start:231 stop:515 length:285 start_codon:yes stop_codon:yes gene_type:complete
MNGTSMYNGIMAYGNIISYVERMLLVGTMQGGIILNVYPVTHAYIVYISPKNRSKPDAAFITHAYITDYSTVFCGKAVLPHLRGLSLYGFNKSH